MAVDVNGLVDAERGLVSRRIFADNEIYEQEQEQIFARCWLFLGLESQIARPGDFITTYIGEDGVIVCRDAHGQIRGLLNSCRHRGNRVCRLDQGRVNSFMCTYHGWTYDLTGKLVGVPGLNLRYTSDFDRDHWSLVPVAQIDTYKGLIFGTFDPEAPPLDEYLGDIRWGMDILLDSREGGTEVVGGIFKWIINCNWKFAADNFIGDNYHGGVTHKSAMIVGHRTENRQVESRTPMLTYEQDRPGFTIATHYGHGFNAPLGTQPGDGHESTPEPLRSYYRATAAETQRRLGTLRARDIPRINCGIFPNLSLSSSSGMLHVWHPKGPMQTEVWLYTLVDKDVPPEVKNAFRLSSQRHFSPTGMFEQDDGENWEQSTLACRGAVGRRYPLNYQQGIGLERIVEDESAPPRVLGVANEHNQRVFYQRWAEMISGKSWNELRPQNA